MYTAKRFGVMAYPSLCKLVSDVASILTNSIDALSMQLLHMARMAGFVCDLIFRGLLFNSNLFCGVTCTRTDGILRWHVSREHHKSVLFDGPDHKT